MEYFLCLILFCVGMYAVLVKRTVVKIIIGFAFMGYALNVLLVLIGYRHKGTVPIIMHNAHQQLPVDPLAQALALTTVITGLAITVLLAALGIRLYQKYGTLDITEIRKLHG